MSESWVDLVALNIEILQFFQLHDDLTAFREFITNYWQSKVTETTDPKSKLINFAVRNHAMGMGGATLRLTRGALLKGREYDVHDRPWKWETSIQRTTEDGPNLRQAVKNIVTEV